MCSIIKLTNGETILAKIISSDNEHLCVNDPVELKIGLNISNHTVVSNLWVPLRGPTTLVALKQEHVIAIANVEEEMSLFYRKAVATIKQDEEEMGKIVSEIRQQVEERMEETLLLKDERGNQQPSPIEIGEEVRNKLFLIRVKTANTVH